MPTPTYTPIATQTTTGTDITFTSISGYRDLILICDGYGAGGLTNVRFQLNNDTGNNYRGQWLEAGTSGNVGGQTGDTNWITVSSNGYSDGKSQCVIQFLDANATDKHKTFLITNAYPDGSYNTVSVSAWRWKNTSAITEIDIDVHPSATVTASLYGVIS